MNEKTRERAGFLTRLKEGLSRSSRALADGISDIFTKKPLDAETLAALEELLIRADLGVSLAAKITARLGEGRHDATIAPHAVRAILAEEIAAVLAPVERALTIDKTHKPFVILVVGVNGSGKTTTIAKLARRFKSARVERRPRRGRHLPGGGDRATENLGRAGGCSGRGQRSRSRCRRRRLRRARSG